MDKWNCVVFEQPEKITVGDKFSISCQGPEPVTFGENIQIILPQKKDSYRLHVLKILKKEPGFLELKVVSYRTGDFSTSFIITDGESQVLGEGLSFSVESVLSEKSQIKPHPPFGPWPSPWSLWRLSFLGMTLLLFLTACFVLGKGIIKRKNFIRKVKVRKGMNSPGQIFAKNLRRKEIASPSYMNNLDRLFRIFLEDLLFVSTLEHPPLVILKSLKKYNKVIYKSHGKRIEAILNEMTEFKNKKTSEDLCRELQKNCLQLAFELEERSGQ